jgi:glucokinase
VINMIEEGLTIGVDLGGTKVKTALVDSKGKIIAEYAYPTQSEKGPESVINDILVCTKTCLNQTDRDEVTAIGIGVAGQVDLNGVLQYAPNLNWHTIDLKAYLERHLELPTLVVNDVRAATWGEWCYGAGQNVSDLIVLFVGTGIGGGVVIDGRLLKGCNNTGGELGHTTIIVNGRQCHCSNKGCLEAYAGGWAIAERAQEAVRMNRKKGEGIVQQAGCLEDITAAHVSLAYHENDTLAHQLVNDTCMYLSAGIVGMINAFNPCLFVFGGGVIEGLPIMIAKIEQLTRDRALKASVENLKFVKAALGTSAGVIGAATLARASIRT